MNVHFSFNGKKSLKEGSRSKRGGHCQKVSTHGSQKALLHKSDLQRGTASFEGVPAGSPSRGGDVAVYVFDINQPSLPTSFYFVLVSVSVFYDLFNCVSFHKFSRQLSAFSLCSSGLISALLILSTIYLFVKVSFSPDIILVVAWA